MKYILLTILFIFSLCQFNAETLRSGDLIFVEEGKGEFSKAITDATTLGDTLVNYVHVGIIEVTKEGNINVIEASPQEGVREISLKEFLKEVPYRDGKPLVETKRLAINFPVEEMLLNAKSHLSEPYDWWFLPNNGKMYCSELVFESYFDEDGNHLFTTKPMNFRAQDGSMPEFWIKLFKQIDQPIPEGIHGTNPNDLSRSQNLISVSCSF